MTNELTRPSVLHAHISEVQWQGQVIEKAELFGWRHYHTLNSQGSTPGFPDLVLVRDTRIIFAELKKATAKPDRHQTAWLTDLAKTDAVEVYVWRPQDTNEVTEILR